MEKEDRRKIDVILYEVGQVKFEQRPKGKWGSKPALSLRDETDTCVTGAKNWGVLAHL